MALSNTRLSPAEDRPSLAHRLKWFALLLLCGAYLQGGLVKLFDFSGAVAEMQHFGLTPAVPMAIATIALELAASAMILLGVWRWLGALALAAFTLLATFVTNRFWSAPPEAQFMMTNAFFEHLGLVGALLLVAVDDLRERRRP
ncbi:DoxX family protein [Cupriavidus sp. AU9028]|uniref:DoxX family protein n=1 Tax=Cupriavidus sp. AU9028 TaxID=2871157 RepID=UPI001C98A5BA|nr:DoxX family protein [Cupriavidus sp. AU9028]MBY4896174.1 DoxX family protein [Cupriavidus sp. AU9028]